jgi:hypothetical protein
VIVVYMAHTNTQDSVHYARRESGTWTSDIEVSSATGATSPSCVMGGSDLCHIYWHIGSTTPSDVTGRTLNSSNTLGTRTDVHNSVTGGTTAGGDSFGKALILASGEIGMCYIKSSANPAFAQMSDAATPVAGTDVNVDSGNGVYVEAQDATYFDIAHIHFCLDPDNDDVYIVMTDDSTFDIHYYVSSDDGDTWGSQSSAVTTGTHAPHCCNIYDDGTNWVLGIGYMSGSVGNFIEVVLRSSDPPVGGDEEDNSMTLLGCGGGV